MTVSGALIALIKVSLDKYLLAALMEKIQDNEDLKR